MLKKSWIAAAIVAAIMLPAAVGTFCLWGGMDEYTLLRQPGMGLAMMPAVFLRIFYIPYALCVISGGCVVLQVIAAFVEKRICWHLPVTMLLTLVACSGLVSLEIFFPAMMGI